MRRVCLVQSPLISDSSEMKWVCQKCWNTGGKYEVLHLISYHYIRRERKYDS